LRLSPRCVFVHVVLVNLWDFLFSRKLDFSQIFIDANCINALQRDPDMNQLEEWAKNGVIAMRLPDTALEEVEKAGSKQRAKTFGILIPCASITTDDEQAMLTKIETIIAEGKQQLSETDKKDAKIVFTAWKHSGAVVVTADGWLLRKAKAIQAAIGVQIMSAADLVNLLRDRIGRRDQRVRECATLRELPVPEWVGED
jgi:predicted nucleic acid-binding protein